MNRYAFIGQTGIAYKWGISIIWLAVILYASIVAAIAMTGIESYWFWVFALAGVAIIYTILGGMWSVAFVDVFQFVFMLNDIYHLLPKTPRGKAAGFFIVAGLLTFFTGIVLGSTGTLAASWVAIIGMCIFFASSLARVYSD